jgi:hypothetical protein
VNEHGASDFVVAGHLNRGTPCLQQGSSAAL